jgi:hypothetical protein
MEIIFAPHSIPSIEIFPSISVEAITSKYFFLYSFAFAGCRTPRNHRARDIRSTSSYLSFLMNNESLFYRTFRNSIAADGKKMELQNETRFSRDRMNYACTKEYIQF